jgi:hypothetical protein
VDEAALARLEDTLVKLRGYGLVVDKSIKDAFRSARKADDVRRERLRLEDTLQSQRVAREQMEMKVQEEVELRARQAERAAREAAQQQAEEEEKRRAAEHTKMLQGIEARRQRELEEIRRDSQLEAVAAADRKADEHRVRLARAEAERRAAEHVQQAARQSRQQTEIAAAEGRALEEAERFGAERAAREAAEARLALMEKKVRLRIFFGEHISGALCFVKLLSDQCLNRSIMTWVQ